jgi:hypothetical protein
MDEHHYTSTDEIDPDDFVSWVFPELFKARVPRYEAIAAQYGYTVDGDEVAAVRSENDFIQLIARAIARHDA